MEVELPRDRVLRTAGELFYANGFHAVGVDLIVERAGVAKTTLYRHFPSKDALIAAYLADANDQFLSWFDRALAQGTSPGEKLLSLFDALERLASSPTCLGCAFQVAAAEFPAADHPGHRVALAHKQAVRTRLTELAEEAGADEPDALGDALALLMDGAFAATRIYGPAGPASRVSAAARSLVDALTTSAG